MRIFGFATINIFEWQLNKENPMKKIKWIVPQWYTQYTLYTKKDCYKKALMVVI